MNPIADIVSLYLKVLNHLDPYKHSATAAATHRDSTNELILCTSSIIVPSIFQQERNTVPLPKSTDKTYTITPTYPYHIISPLYKPSTHTSRLPPILIIDPPFETLPGEHNSARLFLGIKQSGSTWNIFHLEPTSNNNLLRR